MALSVKRDGLRHVPWFSLAEWHEVYKEIYSNDTIEQTKGYERLLVWKSRLSKLPVGVECTMSIMQVCLRDRDLTSKIDNQELPPYHENDLCLMYSTTIMRFLNHISNIGQTRQSSLFQIAKQLKIPQWIVNIRHDAAHGHELPSISVLRIAINILLEWLHEEYWAAESKAMEEHLSKQTEEENEPEEVQTLVDLIELWIAIGLYIHAGYSFVEDIPDAQLRENLNDLRSYVIKSTTDGNEDAPIAERGVKPAGNYTEFSNSDGYKLDQGQSFILAEISRYLSKNKSLSNKEDVVLNALLEGEAFLPSKEFREIFEEETTTGSDNARGDRLPSSLTLFWHEFVTLLQEKEILEKLIMRLLKLVNNEAEKDDKRLIAALWIKHIASGLCKIKISQQIKHRMEQARENNKKKISATALSAKVQIEVDRSFPEYKDVLWFNVLGEIPAFLTDLSFVKKIISSLNSRFSNHFVPVLLELLTPSLDENAKKNLIRFTRVYTNNEKSLNSDKEFTEEVRTVDDFIDLLKVRGEGEIPSEKILDYDEMDQIGDQTVRNTDWSLATLDSTDWGNSPFGILPWQLESMKTLDTFSSKNLTHIGGVGSKEFEVTPGIVDRRSLTMRSKINWDSVLGKKKRPKRKRNRESIDNIVDKAIKIVKKRC